MAPATKKNTPLVPKLRFKEFVGDGEWKKEGLDSLAIAVNDKALVCDSSPALTLSCDFGLIIQGDYFGRNIASQDTSRYTKIIENDFVYNDRITTSYKYGTIKKLSHIESGLVSPIYKCFRFKKEEISIFWECFFDSKTHENELKKLVNEGAREGRYNISISKFLSIKVLRPATPEQQRIADCLTSLDENITAESHKLEALTAHKKALMQKLFPAEGEKVPALRFKEFAGAGEWEEKRLEAVLKQQPDYGVNAPAVPYSDSLPTYLRITDISENGNYIKDNMVSVNIKPTQNNYLEENDIVLTRTGASVGKSYQYVETDGKLVFAGFLIRIKPNSKKIVPKLLANLLKTQIYWDWVKVTSTRSGQPGINSGEFASFSIVIPNDIIEQQRIADCLTSLDEYITAQGHKIALLKEHKKGLMQQLFPCIEEENV